MFTDVAIVAVTAGGGNKGIDHEITRFDIGNAFTYFFDITSCFVSGDSRQLAGTVLTLDHMNVAVTNGGSRAANCYFTFAGRFYNNVLDHQRFSDLVTDRSLDLPSLAHVFLLNDRSDFHTGILECGVSGSFEI
jgi:hypothetical protein